MNGLLVFYLVGVLATFIIGYRTLKGVGEEDITLDEILLLFLLSFGSWLMVIMFGFGKFFKECNRDAKKIFDQYNDEKDIPELDIDDDQVDEELKDKADRQEKFKL
jgi:hypothetical protein